MSTQFIFIWPIVRILLGATVPDQVDLGAMAIKRYSPLPKVPALRQPYHHIVQCHMQDIRWRNLTRLEKCSQGILQPQTTRTPSRQLCVVRFYKDILGWLNLIVWHINHCGLLNDNTCIHIKFVNRYCRSYLPTPPLGQDMTKVNFLSGVQQVWIQSFPSPRLVASPRLKNLVCPTIYP